MPTGVAQNGQVNYDLMAAIDFLTPENGHYLYSTYGDQFGKSLMWWKALNAFVLVKNKTGRHWEENRYASKVTVKTSVASPGVGNPITFNVAAAEVDTSSGTAHAFPVVGDDIYDPLTNVRGHITTIVADATNYTVTAALDISADNWGAKTAGEVFFVYSSKFDEGTDQPESRAAYWTERTWALRTIKNTSLITGLADAMGVQPVQRADDGSMITGYSSVLGRQLEYLHNRSIVGAQIMGVDPTNSNVPDSGNGMLQTFEDRAINYDYGAAITKADLYGVLDALRVNGVHNDYVLWLGYPVYNELEQDLTSESANVNIEAARRSLGAAMFGYEADVNMMNLTFSYNAVVISGTNMALKLNEVTYDPTLFNVSRAIFPTYGFMFPAGVMTDTAGERRRAMSCNYTAQPGVGTRMSRLWNTGGASGRKTNSIDNNQWNILSECGWDWYAIEQCALLYTTLS
jgi:hypothetical protein